MNKEDGIVSEVKYYSCPLPTPYSSTCLDLACLIEHLSSQGPVSVSAILLITVALIFLSAFIVFTTRPTDDV